MTERKFPKWLEFFSLSLSKGMLFTSSFTILLLLTLFETARSDLLIALTEKWFITLIGLLLFIGFGKSLIFTFSRVATQAPSQLMAIYFYSMVLIVGIYGSFTAYFGDSPSHFAIIAIIVNLITGMWGTINPISMIKGKLTVINSKLSIKNIIFTIILVSTISAFGLYYSYHWIYIFNWCLFAGYIKESVFSHKSI